MVMEIGPHGYQEERYRGILISSCIHYSAEGGRLVVTSCHDSIDIDDVCTTEDCNPTSILPWRNPEPRSDDEHVADNVEVMKRRIDEMLDVPS